MRDESFTYLHNLAIFCLRYGRFEDARILFELLDLIRPQDTSILLGLAKAHNELNQPEECLEVLGRLGRLAPGDESYDAWRWLHLVASSARHQEKQ